MNSNANQGPGVSPDFYDTLGLSLGTRQGMAYASVEQMIAQYCPQAQVALDYGCGTGRSAQLLKQAGLAQVIGVDISQDMLNKAQDQEMPGVSYELIESGNLPFDNGSFELTFSGLVLLEIPTPDEITKVLEELTRVTTPGGIVMTLTCTKEGYAANSASFECLLTEEAQDNLKDGNPVPIRVKATGQKFTDYFWSDEFLRAAFEQTGLKIEAVNFPNTPPEYAGSPHYAIYVCSKP